MGIPATPTDDDIDSANASRLSRNSVTPDVTISTASSIRGQQTAETIRGIAQRIREKSIRMRELVVALRQSGAVDELVDSFREASLATRDTAKEINHIARALRERGAIIETAVAIDETTKAAQETAETVRIAANEVGESAPITSDMVRRTARAFQAISISDLINKDHVGEFDIDKEESLSTLSAKLTDIEKSVRRGKRLRHKDRDKINELRRSLLVKEKGRELPHDIAENCQKILVEDLSKSFEQKVDDPKAKEEKMLLYHWKVRVQQNDPRSLAEIKNEYNEFAKKADRVAYKILP